MGMKKILKRAFRYIVKGVPVVNVKAKITQVNAGNLLKGRNIIITGGSRGIGLAIAKKCISEGAVVLITGRNEDTLKSVSESLGKNCKYLPFDMQSVADIPLFFKKAKKMFGGKIDSLVNNAGVSLHEGNLFNVTEEGWDKQFDTNLKGTYFFTQHFINQLKEYEDITGNILFISSERGLYCDDIPYGLTKSALNSFVKGLARQVIKDGIRVNAIAPGITATEMTGFTTDNLYLERIPGKRVFLPEEMAEVACFLLSNASACIAGEIIACDHGNYYKANC